MIVKRFLPYHPYLTNVHGLPLYIIELVRELDQLSCSAVSRRRVRVYDSPFIFCRAIHKILIGEVTKCNFLFPIVEPTTVVFSQIVSAEES
ncbi:hypothetical protein L2E82_21708 [Cichorium intybus]|uniref:Uncharacterized protein n=1 Tax=Cichorium intybus TaxID=13427 RepID=A0ACB9DWM0_CICIN|nr:hypothetical protein L2E82_21708 [Cichorium intybus]